MLWIPNLTDIEIKDNVFLHKRKQDHFIFGYHNIWQRINVYCRFKI